MSTQSSGQYLFSYIRIPPEHVFVETQLSFAFVNLKPVVPGHVLVSPKRVEPRFATLTSEEVSDLWQLVQRVGRTIEKVHNAEALTLAIQDGPAAGQSVAHVHVHVLPRREGDLPRKDDIYDEIDAKSKALPQMETVAEQRGKFDLDEERLPRSFQEMADEAASLRPLFHL